MHNTEIGTKKDSRLVPAVNLAVEQGASATSIPARQMAISAIEPGPNYTRHIVKTE